ncbi:MAG: type II toxin-antitoxin system RelE/ParE family toxin [Firmicutes bacterium]|nr:type II toxin-antitoxin system RelE/ParE family toxin [Bacillota bacterium]
MPKMKVVLLNEARMELRDIAVYHKLKVGINSARKITDRILGALDRLIDFPEMGNVPPAKMIAEAAFRVLIVDDYLCFYQLVDEQIIVYHIVHGSTNYIKRLF